MLIPLDRRSSSPVRGLSTLHRSPSLWLWEHGGRPRCPRLLQTPLVSVCSVLPPCAGAPTGESKQDRRNHLLLPRPALHSLRQRTLRECCRSSGKCLPCGMKQTAVARVPAAGRANAGRKSGMGRLECRGGPASTAAVCQCERVGSASSSPARGQQVRRRWRKDVDPRREVKWEQRPSWHCMPTSSPREQLRCSKGWSPTSISKRLLLTPRRKPAEAGAEAAAPLCSMLVPLQRGRCWQQCWSCRQGGWEAVRISTCEWQIVESKTCRMAWVEKDLEDHLVSTPLQFYFFPSSIGRPQ
eukprot:XP_015128348.2 uncharacterized protein LOC107049386 [Gallus gallus]